MTETSTFTDLRCQFEPMLIGPKGYYNTPSECREAWDQYADQDPTRPLSLPFQVARCERWLADVNRLERVRRQGPQAMATSTRWSARLTRTCVTGRSSWRPSVWGLLSSRVLSGHAAGSMPW
jgi:hypothetical protein